MGTQLIPTGVATGGAGAIFRKEVVQAIAAATRFVLPVGAHYVFAVGANIQLQVLDSLGAWNNLGAVGVAPPGAQISDGVGLALFNGAGAAQNASYIQIG